MEDLFFIALYTSAGVLLVLMTILSINLHYRRKLKMSYKSACAGSPHDNTPKERIASSIYANTFLDNEGNPLDVDKFNWFIACGESMHLSGIDDGNIVFTKKGYTFDEKEDFPSIFVLKRDKKDEKSQFKIRRGWKVVDFVNKEDMMKNLETVMDSGKFKDIIINKNKTFYPGSSAIIKDFESRCLPEYLRNFQPNIKTDNRKVMISTTLHTDENKIYFSIHPTSLITGKVLYSFTMND